MPYKRPIVYSTAFKKRNSLSTKQLEEANMVQSNEDHELKKLANEPPLTTTNTQVRRKGLET